MINLKYWTAALRKAEQELDAATRIVGIASAAEVTLRQVSPWSALVSWA
jgi:hypothetical protein